MPSMDLGNARRALSKLRRDKSDNNSSIRSVESDSGDDDDKGENTGLRASVDAAIEKVKVAKDRATGRLSMSDDRDESISAARRLSTFISRKKRSSKRDPHDLDKFLTSDSGGETAENRSQASLLFDESGRSSLLTSDDSIDPDGQSIRPSLSRHESHSGYLTLSSPEINSSTNPVSIDSLAEAFTDSPASAPFITNIPLIIEPDDTTASVSLPTERNLSPAEKLKGAFKIAHKKSVSETDSIHSAASGSSGFGSLFRPSSRGSSRNRRTRVESEIEVETPEPAQSIGNEVSQGSDSRPETPLQAGRRPLTIFPVPTTPPNTVETPTTLVTPPTPTDPTFTEVGPSSVAPLSPLSRNSTLSEKSWRRRANSGSAPSKLSQSINAPLTPTLEETKTPGGTLTQPSPGGGFFTSVFSAAQKAADQLTSTINASSGSSHRTKALAQQTAEDDGGEEAIPGPESRTDIEGGGSEEKTPAVVTLGKGNLRLSHLGLSETPESSTMHSTTNLQQQDEQSKNGDNNRKIESDSAARAVSVAYEKPAPSAISHGRPMSISSVDRLGLAGDQTPPRVDLESGGIKRSGSVRSKLSGRRRHRGSSATTGNTIAAAMKDTAAGLANPSVNGSGHRLTGFAVASSKRNKEFHQLFRSVPEDDYLIEDYSAALQRDILLHGRLYVSEGHICFSSNILGWVTNLVISFSEIVTVEKKSTAVIFPNAIVISTLHARNTFASFVARDSTYELLIGIWKISHPNLKSSLNGVTLDDAGTGDKTEVADADGSDDDSDDDSDDEVYDEDADDDVGSFTDGGVAASHAGSDAGDTIISRKTSAAPVGTNSQQHDSSPKGLENTDAVVTGAAVGSDFPGPPNHGPTECSEAGEHYDRPLIDTTIPAPLGKVYSMMFGPASGQFMRKWLVEDQKSRELHYADDKTGLDNDHKTFTFDYIKPLNAPVGPKQTKCITTASLLAFDFDKAISIDCSTSTPDVPSGNVFTVKTRYCLMWGPGGSTRMVATCTIEWTGKSWLKGPIEKGANDGQIDYVKSIVIALKAAVTTKPPVKGVAKKGKRKGRKEVFDAEEANNQREASIAAEQQASSWGLLEPLRAILDPILSIIRPFISSQVIIAVLFLLLIYNWMQKPRNASSIGFPGATSAERVAAYEELWKREENALWNWLEDRVGIDNVYAVPLSERLQERQQVLRAKDMGKKLDEERMQDRQLDEAIRTTEDRLEALKEAVKRKNMQKLVS